jgi:hypothetical protein
MEILFETERQLLRKSVYAQCPLDHVFLSRDKPISRDSANDFERSLIDVIDRENLGLELRKTMGFCRREFFIQERIAVYRLTSQAHGEYAEFILRGDAANILLVHAFPSGNFWNLKKFVMGKVVKLLFEAHPSLNAIVGCAGSNGKKASKRRDSNQLLKLWQLVGFSRSGSGNDLILTRQDFERLRARKFI